LDPDRGLIGEDIVETQNAEVGQMPMVPNEPLTYGDETEDRHCCRVFLGKAITLPAKGVGTFVPAVAKGTWKGR
jgi:hypothetical protein